MILITRLSEYNLSSDGFACDDMQIVLVLELTSFKTRLKMVGKMVQWRAFVKMTTNCPVACLCENGKELSSGVPL